MKILIDGYNLLHVSGLLGRGGGRDQLERARRAMLNVLAHVLGPDETGNVTIVFDAPESSEQHPQIGSHRGMRVVYAVSHATADDLIAELIQQEGTPSSLLVVSGDREIQRAARRRRAKSITSAKWWDELDRRQSDREQPVRHVLGKPETPLTPEEVAYWVDLFDDQNVSNPPPPPHRPDDAASRGPGAGDQVEDDELLNPFPPGYAEDLLKHRDDS